MVSDASLGLSNDSYEAWERCVSHLKAEKYKGWEDKANCKSVGTLAMFPSGIKAQRKVAQKVCMVCPVQEKCLTYALVAREEFGVWGGAAEQEREKILIRIQRKRNWIFRDWPEDALAFFEEEAAFWIKIQHNSVSPEKAGETTQVHRSKS